LSALAQDAALARNLAATCASCHGSTGNARGEFRSLEGVAAERIIVALADFKSGAQPATVMQQIARGYTEAQIKLLADYFAAQSAPR
jgi:cytochrome c553